MEITTGGEIGRMGLAFNLMTDQLAEISKAFKTRDKITRFIEKFVELAEQLEV